MSIKKTASVFGVAAALTLAVAAPAAAAATSGNINCSNVAAVQARTNGATWVAPPGEAAIFRGTFAGYQTTTTYEASSPGTYWTASGSSGLIDSETYAYCTNLGW